MIRTSARNLAGPVRRTLGVQSFQMIKNRINCDTGFARGIMEKYSLGEGGLPPASFVFLETGRDSREEEGRTIELLFQILRYEDYGINIAFRNMVLGFLKQNVEFRLERMKSLSGENYVKFYGIYERVLKIVEAPAEGGTARGRRENKDSAGYEGEREGAGETLLHEIEEERRRQRELVERELVSLETEIRGDGMFLSGEAARVREFLETLPGTEQEYLAQVIGTSREALMERLRMVNRREWRILEEEILSSLRRSEQFFLERQAADREQAARPEGQGYQALTDGEGPLRNGEELLEDEEVSLKEGEESLRDGAGLEAWKSIFRQWVGFMDTEEWETVTEAVRRYRGSGETVPQAEQILRTGDKEKVMGFLAEAQSMEELYPLIDFIYRDRDLKEQFQGWLPGLEETVKRHRAFAQAETLGPADSLELRRQAAARLAGFLEEEEWLNISEISLAGREREDREAYIGQIEKLKGEDRREVLTPAAELFLAAEDENGALDGRGFDGRVPVENAEAGGSGAEEENLRQWKTIFATWLGALEPGEWEAVARTMDGQKSSFGGGEEFFGTRDKERAVWHLMETESMEEFYPLVEFIYEDRDISERFGEFLPAEIHPPQREYRRDIDRPEPEWRAAGRLAELLEHERAESMERLRREVSLVSLGEWKEVLGKWLSVLEKEEWEAVVQSMERPEGFLQGTKRQYWTESREKAMETLSAAESVEELYPLIDFIYRDGKLREQSGRMPAAQMVSVEGAYGKETDRLEKRRQAVGRLTELLENERKGFPGLYERGISGAVPEQWGEALDKWQKVMEGEKTAKTAALETWKYRLRRWIGSLKKEEWETFVRIVRQRGNVLAVGTKEILDEDGQEKAAKLLADTQSMEEIRPLLGLLCGDEREYGTPGERRTGLEGYDSVERDGLELRKQAAGRLARILERQEEKGRSGGTAGEADEGGASFDREQSALRRQILGLPDSVWREVRRLTEPVLRKKVFLRQVEEGGHEEVEQALLILKEENRTYYGDARGQKLAAVEHWPRDGARSVWQSLVSGKAGWKNPERGKESFIEEVERLGEPEEITGLLELFYRKEPVKSMAEGWIPGEQEAKEWYRESKEEAGRVTRQLKDNIRDWIGFLEENQWKAVENRILEESREGKAAGLIETWKDILGKSAGYAGIRDKGDGVVEHALFRNVRFNHRSFGEKEASLGRSGQAYENRERHGVRRETGRQFFWTAAATEEEGRQPGRGMVLLTRRGRTGVVSRDRRRPEDMPGGELWHVSAGHFPAGEDRPGEEPGREEEGFAYMPADMVMSRLGDGRRREQVKTPGADIERAVYQIKEEAVKDIQFTVRQRGNEGDGQNGQQVKELLKKFAAQQKELEELKKGQANLIRTMSADHVTDMVMKQFRDQLRIEKLRRGL